ncbi:aldose 1-epimerase [Niveibacterium sp. 24ML]|uniref:aldose 1-epimerase n=1 Tax=Niveibacterium sp. 24ML TaxID=2985512 RepID=UPI00226F5F70|nr:aldose 1-epimerase [Niveibacterium sp. 24ML]MCX9156902.1 aldose 1-epimerase [Niveibacterium sp. 24ML]
MLDQEPELITLQAGACSAVIAPAIGGRLFACTAEVDGQVRDLILPVPRDQPLAKAIANAGCYPLVPFSNRIENARFEHQGRSVALTAHPLGAPHAIHGIGWVKPWSVVECNGRAASLRIDHEADAWPWSFSAEQTFSLDSGGLTVSMLVTNRSDSAMPCGMGFHPYFPCPAGTRLRARVRDHWLLRPDCIPCGNERALGRFPFDGTTPLRSGLDDGFSGWDRRARLDYADYSIELTATPGLDRLVVYSPTHLPLVCVEPVSHITNAMNLEAVARRQAGWRVIEPGASWLESMHLAGKSARA